MDNKPQHDRDGATRWYSRGHSGYFMKDMISYDSRIPVITHWIKDNLKPKSKILDVGCGDMSLANLMPDQDWTGYDLDPKKDPRIIKQDIASTPYECTAQSYDALVCSEVLEHVFNPHEVIYEFNRILKLNGIAIITVPNFDSIEFYLDDHRQLLFDTKKFWTLEHIRWYNIQNMTELLNGRGFKILEVAGTAHCFSGILSYAQTELHKQLELLGHKMTLAEAGRILGKCLPCYSPGISFLCQKVM